MRASYSINHLLVLILLILSNSNLFSQPEFLWTDRAVNASKFPSGTLMIQDWDPTFQLGNLTLVNLSWNGCSVTPSGDFDYMDAIVVSNDLDYGYADIEILDSHGGFVELLRLYFVNVCDGAGLLDYIIVNESSSNIDLAMLANSKVGFFGRFDINHPETFANIYWYGGSNATINVNPNTDVSFVDCTFDRICDFAWGGIEVDGVNSFVKVENCEISRSIGGIYYHDENSLLKIEGVKFHSNYIGIEISNVSGDLHGPFFEGGHVSITNNEFDMMFSLVNHGLNPLTNVAIRYPGRSRIQVISTSQAHHHIYMNNTINEFVGARGTEPLIKPNIFKTGVNFDDVWSVFIENSNNIGITNAFMDGSSSPNNRTLKTLYALNSSFSLGEDIKAEYSNLACESSCALIYECAFLNSDLQFNDPIDGDHLYVYPSYVHTAGNSIYNSSIHGGRILVNAGVNSTPCATDLRILDNEIWRESLSDYDISIVLKKLTPLVGHNIIVSNNRMYYFEMPFTTNTVLLSFENCQDIEISENYLGLRVIGYHSIPQYAYRTYSIIQPNSYVGHIPNNGVGLQLKNCSDIRIYGGYLFGLDEGVKFEGANSFITTNCLYFIHVRNGLSLNSTTYMSDLGGFNDPTYNSWDFPNPNGIVYPISFDTDNGNGAKAIAGINSNTWKYSYVYPNPNSPIGFNLEHNPSNIGTSSSSKVNTIGSNISSSVDNCTSYTQSMYKTSDQSGDKIITDCAISELDFATFEVYTMVGQLLIRENCQLRDLNQIVISEMTHSEFVIVKYENKCGETEIKKIAIH